MQTPHRKSPIYQRLFATSFICALLFGPASESATQTKSAIRNVSNSNKAATKAKITTNQAKITQRELLNCDCLVPCLGDGDDTTIRLKDGSYFFKDESMNGNQHGYLSNIAIGTINGSAAAAGLLIWNTGGSGTWDSILLFKKLKGVAQAVGKYSLGYPANQGSVFQNFRIAHNEVLLDVKHAELAPRINSEVFAADAKDTYLKTATALKPLTSIESSNASLQIPTKDTIEKEDFESINIKLTNGSYSSNEVTCKIESIANTKIDKAPITLIALRIQYKSSKAPLAIVYRLRRVKDVATWDALYTLCNTYRFGSVSNLQLTTEDEKLKLDIDGVALNLSDFQKPSYGGQSAAAKTPAT
jgi:hypothetical protein